MKDPLKKIAMGLLAASSALPVVPWKKDQVRLLQPASHLEARIDYPIKSSTCNCDLSYMPVEPLNAVLNPYHMQVSVDYVGSSGMCIVDDPCELVLHCGGTATYNFSATGNAGHCEFFLGDENGNEYMNCGAGSTWSKAISVDLCGEDTTFLVYVYEAGIFGGETLKATLTLVITCGGCE